MLSRRSGDSRAVLGQYHATNDSIVAVALSRDHRPESRPDERQRVESLGGSIVFSGGAMRVQVCAVEGVQHHTHVREREREKRVSILISSCVGLRRLHFALSFYERLTCEGPHRRHAGDRRLLAPAVRFPEARVHGCRAPSLRASVPCARFGWSLGRVYEPGGTAQISFPISRRMVIQFFSFFCVCFC